MEHAPIICIENVSFRYGSRIALDKVSFTVSPAKVTVLLGPNGAGKTTLFSLIARLLPLREGSIRLDGFDLASVDASIFSHMGIVFQQSALDLDLTVRQNLAYGANLHGLSWAKAETKLKPLLADLDLLPRLSEKIRTLNGGHRRRVEIARALISEPRLLLLDEPTTGLDIPTRASLVDFLHKFARDRNIGVLWATHLIDEAKPGDDIIILNAGQVRTTGIFEDVVARAGAASLQDAFRSFMERQTS